ncbi:MAG: DUF1003 domain-containing protein [Actinomyces succiniciruminis]|uniref:Integral membrane protein n=1 Tax=Actinomyces succiniciruminis TaxID=1522002 RepID=A0A1L7RNB2_9ACTO|nr:DUF1003 domain-containing protein [Actinomyces succiniciruminis]MBE6476241.1 DUF1003 domain-containing protein [Actinomyces succiniciruminis]MBM6980258.1 DUF1003 domain-containing protein [Actinomyces succiniciruminis]CED90784.1 Integral membrane protein [Actinomyces succiniciruminis]
MPDQLDQPLSKNRSRWMRWTHPSRSRSDTSGRVAEAIARFSGTPTFLIWLTVFVALWMIWNSWGPENLRFDRASLGFTALTLMLSLQASYSAPLILLAQNRQDDRDRVTAEQDRQRAERNLEDTEYLTREIASLRLAMNDVATRDFVRSELRVVLEELLQEERRTREELHDDIVDEGGETPDAPETPDGSATARPQQEDAG